ncbi:PREDICTED: methylmalonyl-CoA epimerase, mitochondrial [Haliaeetus leucocephalus]|uniref:methylmalonyl-CoA epimerase, mitochondrial n=1 Tax=Haliaeetus leucocephalus TaxID=52644 RepID=UPI00053CB531|nr:PREDICTED: methylmalonyl-CoA epimerase, mitochondrial [Haliaeetus leucocephalus]
MDPGEEAAAPGGDDPFLLHAAKCALQGLPPRAAFTLPAAVPRLPQPFSTWIQNGLLTRLQTSAPAIRTLSSSNSFSQNIPSSLWKLGRLNHVAIAVPDLEKAQSLYKDVLGAQVSETVALPEHGVYVVFVELGNTKLELLHPLGEKSPIASFLQKNKTGGMHHICIEVDDIKAAMTELKKKKIRILSEEPKIGAHGKPVIFLHPKDCHGVLVELEQA